MNACCLGAGSFFQSSVGDPHGRGANVVGEHVTDRKTHKSYMVFSPTRAINKGEDLLYMYHWEQNDEFPWWLFFPKEHINAVFPARATPAAMASAFARMGYAPGHRHFLDKCLTPSSSSSSV